MNAYENEELKPLEEATSSTPLETNFIPTLKEDDEVLEMNEDFDFENFQVVRREFFAHLSEPCISFKNCKITINKACLNKFPKTMYAQALISDKKKILALRPCEEGARDSFLWCGTDKNGTKKSRTTTCKIFFAKLVDLMGWIPEHRYKLLGKLIHANGQYLLAFDLTAAQVYPTTYTENEKPISTKTPIFPAEWQNQFGLPFREHRKSMQINVFDGYAIYSIKDKPVQKTENPITEETGGETA